MPSVLRRSLLPIRCHRARTRFRPDRALGHARVASAPERGIVCPMSGSSVYGRQRIPQRLRVGINFGNRCWPGGLLFPARRRGSRLTWRANWTQVGAAIDIVGYTLGQPHGRCRHADAWDVAFLATDPARAGDIASRRRPGHRSELPCPEVRRRTVSDVAARGRESRCRAAPTTCFSPAIARAR